MACDGASRKRREREKDAQVSTSEREGDAGRNPLESGAKRGRENRLVRKLLVAMLLAVLVYGGFAVWRGIGKIGDELGRFQFWAFAAACSLAFCNYLVRWLKWEFYLARLNIRGVGRVD